MSNLFSTVLNMSMTGSVVILLVMIARLILKRAPKIFSYALWSVVLFRLLCPVAFTASVSVLNALEPEVQEASESTSVVYFIPTEVNQNQEFMFVPAENESGTELVQAGESEHTRLDLMTVVSYVWITGTGIMILYSVIQYIRLRLKLVGAVAYRGNVYRADYIDTPFVMGVFSPKIYLPSDVPMNERKYIIAHERHHIRRCDHIIKLLAYLALCIHWFNPLVWAAFILAGKDMEMSCDEAVIRKMGSQIRADYSASLLRLATHKKIIAGMPLAFGEGDTKGRVMNMAKWKKPKLWVSVICLLLCAAILVACAVNPQNDESTVYTEQQASADTKKITLENAPLPEGYFEDLDEEGNIIFTDGVNTIGGVMCYVIPEGIYDPDDKHFDWLAEMGIPDFVDQNLVYLGGITSGDNGWAAEFADELDNESKRTVYRRHTFQVVEDTVYDIWFDLLKISFDDAYEIRRAVNIPESLTETVTMMPTVPGSDITTDTQLVQYGALKLLLPSGLSTREQDGDIVLTKDSVDVGGIRHWNYPEFQPSDIVELMQEESGAPIGFMSGSSAYGDTEYEIFWDGNPDGLNEQHTFFIDGDIIYDVWYDQNLISDGIAERFLKTVAINSDPVVEENPDEQVAFAKCRTVLDAIQNGSYHIVIEQSSRGDSQSRWSTANYYQDNGNWLKIVDVNPEKENMVDGEQYSVRMAFMVANNVHYSNEGNWGKAYTDIEWREDNLTFNDGVKPWLASFQWDDSVAYMDTQIDENGECIMLRVDEKYIDSDEYDPHYFLYFNFDPDGNFVNAQLQVNLFRDNELAITESIASMDPEVIDSEIQKEYQKAIG